MVQRPCELCEGLCRIIMKDPSSAIEIGQTCAHDRSRERPVRRATMEATKNMSSSRLPLPL